MKKQYFEHIYLALVFYLGIFLKIVLWNYSPYISRDSAQYLGLIDSFYKIGGYEFIRDTNYNIVPPLFFYATCFLKQYGITTLNAGLIVNIYLGSLVPIVVYYSTCLIFKKRIISASSALLALFHPTLVSLSIEIQRDIGFVLLSGILFYYSISLFLHIKYDTCFVIGFLLPFCVLFRIEGLEYFFILFVIGITAIILNGCSWGKFVMSYASIVLSFVLTLFLLSLCLGVPLEYLIQILKHNIV